MRCIYCRSPAAASPGSRNSPRHAAKATKQALALSLVLLAAGHVRADGTEVLLRYGQDDPDYEGASLGLRLSPWWLKDLNGWRAALHPELEVTHFRYNGSQPGPTSMNEIGGLGMFRIERSGGGLRPYAEIGLGASLFSSDRLGTRNFSTHFQFNEHIGLGVEFAGTWFAGWRYTHYSNANIKRPNNGLDLQQIVIGVRF